MTHDSSETIADIRVACPRCNIIDPLRSFPKCTRTDCPGMGMSDEFAKKQVAYLQREARERHVRKTLAKLKSREIVYEPTGEVIVGRDVAYSARSLVDAMNDTSKVGVMHTDFTWSNARFCFICLAVFLASFGGLLMIWRYWP